MFDTSYNPYNLETLVKFYAFSAGEGGTQGFSVMIWTIRNLAFMGSLGSHAATPIVLAYSHSTKVVCRDIDLLTFKPTFLCARDHRAKKHIMPTTLSS